MKHRLFLTAFAILGLASAVWAQSSEFRVIGSNGEGNVVFSTTKIEKGKEQSVTMATKFTSKDPIWARAYFPAEIGELEGEAEGFIDIWIDGSHAKRMSFTNKTVAADHDQTSIYIHNTGSDDFKADVWSGLTPGEHRVKVVVGKTELVAEKVKLDVEGDDVVAKRDDAYKAVYLAESEFTYVEEP